MRHIKFLLIIISTFFASKAFAQCRVGSGPDMGDGIPYCSDISPQATQSYSPIWEDRWGAIAIDPNVNKGGFGTAENMQSKKVAEKHALKQCMNSGGTKTCKIEVSYYNQCAVIAWGDDNYHWARAEFIELASEMALEGCSKDTQNCKIFYSNCNYPVRVR